MWPSPAAATCTEYRRFFRSGACGSTRPAPRRACSPTLGRSAASEVRAFRLRRNEPHSVLLGRSRLAWAQRTLRSRCLQPFVAAVAPHRFRHLDSTAVCLASRCIAHRFTDKRADKRRRHEPAHETRRPVHLRARRRVRRAVALPGGRLGGLQHSEYADVHSLPHLATSAM